MRTEEEIRAEKDRLEAIVYDPNAEAKYGDGVYVRLAARWNALKWALGEE